MPTASRKDAVESKPPFTHLLQGVQRLVEATGIEPATTCLQSRRSTN